MSKTTTKIALAAASAALVGLAVTAGMAGSSLLNGDSTPTSATNQSPYTYTSPTTTMAAKSPAAIEAEQTAVAAARAAETARMDPATYEVISPREYALLVKNPDAAKGRKIIIYGYVTQFDAATGTYGFRANTAATPGTDWYDYDVNTVVSAPAGQSNILTNVVEDDFVTMHVEVVGSYSYDTQIGGNTTVPQFQVNIINVTAHKS